MRSKPLARRATIRPAPLRTTAGPTRQQFADSIPNTIIRSPTLVQTIDPGLRRRQYAGAMSTPFIEDEAASPSLLIEQYSADCGSVSRKFPFEFSEARAKAFDSLFQQWLDRLKPIDDSGLDPAAALDLVLLENTVAKEQFEHRRTVAQCAAAARLLPSWAQASGLTDDLCQFQFITGDAAAAALAKTAAEAAPLAEDPHGIGFSGKEQASLASRMLAELIKALDKWHHFYKGYDPEFTWWTAAPMEASRKALTNLRQAIRKEIIGEKSDEEDEVIVGQPVGRDVLVQQLGFERIAYTPEELIAIGEKQMDWCRNELKKAAHELGLGDDPMAAVEHLKLLHEPPGGQPTLVRDLALEAIEYLDRHDLLTMPELMKQTWRMSMMPADRQKVNPFFLGGEKIIVSFPTSEMDDAAKRMSLRGNNRHFARATVQHELIPGHHVQQYMNGRHHPYRSAFWTCFWVEGWTLYWELFLWDHGFPRGPEDRVGMLFWRMHRAARIVFSLKFHLGQMSAQECVDMLVDEVGHERANAEGEVRRSLLGTYPELYQAAYMIGGLQVYALSKEMQAAGWTPKQFHDRMIRENQMPIEALRCLILGTPLPREPVGKWRFC